MAYRATRSVSDHHQSPTQQAQTDDPAFAVILAPVFDFDRSVFEDDYGAAASLFESGIDGAVGQGLQTGEAMLEWWGSAVERHADALERDARIAAFVRLRDRMARELGRNPASSAAAYWLVVGTRGTGEAVAAWDAAIAGWVRARLAGARSAALRSDLDKLMLEGIIPDRVRAIATDRRAQAESDLRAEWAVVKERWK